MLECEYAAENPILTSLSRAARKPTCTEGLGLCASSVDPSESPSDGTLRFTTGILYEEKYYTSVGEILSVSMHQLEGSLTSRSLLHEPECSSHTITIKNSVSTTTTDCAHSEILHLATDNLVPNRGGHPGKGDEQHTCKFAYLSPPLSTCLQL